MSLFRQILQTGMGLLACAFSADRALPMRGFLRDAIESDLYEALFLGAFPENVFLSLQPRYFFAPILNSILVSALDSGDDAYIITQSFLKHARELLVYCEVHGEGEARFLVVARRLQLGIELEDLTHRLERGEMLVANDYGEKVPIDEKALPLKWFRAKDLGAIVSLVSSERGIVMLASKTKSGGAVTWAVREDEIPQILPENRHLWVASPDLIFASDVSSVHPFGTSAFVALKNDGSIWRFAPKMGNNFLKSKNRTTQLYSHHVHRNVRGVFSCEERPEIMVFETFEMEFVLVDMSLNDEGGLMQTFHLPIVMEYKSELFLEMPRSLKSRAREAKGYRDEQEMIGYLLLDRLKPNKLRVIRHQGIPKGAKGFSVTDSPFGVVAWRKGEAWNLESLHPPPVVWNELEHHSISSLHTKMGLAALLFNSGTLVLWSTDPDQDVEPRLIRGIVEVASLGSEDVFFRDGFPVFMARSGGRLIGINFELEFLRQGERLERFRWNIIDSSPLTSLDKPFLGLQSTETAFIAYASDETEVVFGMHPQSSDDVIGYFNPDRTFNRTLVSVDYMVEEKELIFYHFLSGRVLSIGRSWKMQWKHYHDTKKFPWYRMLTETQHTVELENEDIYAPSFVWVGTGERLDTEDEWGKAILEHTGYNAQGKNPESVIPFQ